MIREIQADKTQERLYLTSDIVFSQVPTFWGKSNRQLSMSLIRGTSRSGGPRPVIIWICGGAWQMMDRDFWVPEMSWFARRGYVVASITYRLSNEAAFPAQLEDVKSAIRYLKAHAEQYNLDQDRFAVMGESAGGYLAAMAGTTGSMTRAFDTGEYLGISSEVQAVVDWYGPSDLASLLTARYGEDNRNAAAAPEALLLGFRPDEEPERAAGASPLTYISRHTPPFLILHGDADEVVPAAQSALLYEALTEAGVEAHYLKVRGAGHASLEFTQPPVMEAVAEFLDKHLKQA